MLAVLFRVLPEDIEASEVDAWLLGRAFNRQRGGVEPPFADSAFDAVELPLHSKDALPRLDAIWSIGKPWSSNSIKSRCDLVGLLLCIGSGLTVLVIDAYELTNIPAESSQPRTSRR